MNATNVRKAMKPPTTLRALCLCGLLSVASSAYAMPFSVVSMPSSGERGSTITSALFDGGVDNLEGADILLTFDSDFFSYLGESLGSATGGSFLMAGVPTPAGGSLRQVEMSLATAALVDGLEGSLVEVRFLIKPTAPLGDSELVFESVSPDYAIPRTVGRVTVLPTQGGAVPEPTSAWLVGFAVLGLGVLRRARKRAG
jgi:hypothetical protein